MAKCKVWALGQNSAKIILTWLGFCVCVCVFTALSHIFNCHQMKMKPGQRFVVRESRWGPARIVRSIKPARARCLALMGEATLTGGSCGGAAIVSETHTLWQDPEAAALGRPSPLLSLTLRGTCVCNSPSFPVTSVLLPHGAAAHGRGTESVGAAARIGAHAPVLHCLPDWRRCDRHRPPAKCRLNTAWPRGRCCRCCWC